jgi:hypothetical protein
MNSTKSESQRRNFLPAKLTYEKASDTQLGSPVAAIEAGAGPSSGGSRISGSTKEHRTNPKKNTSLAISTDVQSLTPPELATSSTEERPAHYELRLHTAGGPNRDQWEFKRQAPSRGETGSSRDWHEQTLQRLKKTTWAAPPKH